MRLLDGGSIFKLMDSHGMPFDLINDMMRERGLAVDFPAFLRAAHGSKNYSKKRILSFVSLYVKHPEAVERSNKIIESLWI